MRFSYILSILAGATFVLAHPLAEPSFTEQELVLRDDGDVGVFLGRDITTEEIRERDLAFTEATGGDLDARSDILSEDEIEELAARLADEHLDERDLIDVEPRAVAAIVRGVAQGIIKIVQAIKGQIEKDKGRRGVFTSTFIDKALKAPGKPSNWVICHTKHHYKFDGKRGVDWEHRHEEFNVAFGKTVGYEIYRFKSGVFTREGDGGYLNWAYGGNIKGKSKDGKVVTFGPR